MRYLTLLAKLRKPASDSLIAKIRQHLQQKDFEAAIHYAEEALKTARSRHEPWRLRIEARAKAGAEPDEIKRVYQAAQRAKKLDPTAAAKQALHVLRRYVCFFKASEEFSETKSFDTPDIARQLRGLDSAEDLIDALIKLLESAEPGLRNNDGLAAGRLLAEAGLGRDMDPERSARLWFAAIRRAMKPETEQKDARSTSPAGLLLAYGFIDSAVGSVADGTSLRRAGEAAFQIIDLLPEQSKLARRQGGSQTLVSTGLFSDNAPSSSSTVGTDTPAFKQTQAPNGTSARSNGPSETESDKQGNGTAMSLVSQMNKLSNKVSRIGLMSKANKPVTNTREHADALFTDKEYNEAFKAYEQLVVRNAEDWRSLDRAAACLRQLDRASSAQTLVRTFGPIYAKRANNEKHLYRLALSASSLNGESRVWETPLRLQVEDFLHAGMRRNKTDEEYWRELLRIQIARAQYNMAKDTLVAFEKSCPASPHVPLGKSLLARFTGDFDEAEAQANLAAANGPKSTTFTARLHLADACLAKGQIARACNILQNAIPLNPGNHEAKLKYINALIMLGALTCARTAASEHGIDKLVAHLQAHAGPKQSRATNVVLQDTATDAGCRALSPSLTAGQAAERLQNEQTDWLVFSNRPLAGETVRRLAAETRPGIGFTFAASAGAELKNVAPPPKHAFALGLRPEDFLRLCALNPAITVHELLGTAIRVLAGQYVPNAESEDLEVLGLTAAPPASDILLTDLALSENTLQDSGWNAAPLPKGYLRDHVFGHDGPILLDGNSLTDRLPVLGTQAPLLLSLEGLSSARRAEIDQSDSLQATWHANLHMASVVIVTERDVAEWLEDRFKMAVYVCRDLSEGLNRAGAFLRRRFVVHLGAGLGNQLQGTPLIRFISEFLRAPVDVCISSVVPISHELFGESRYINTAYYSDRIQDGRQYDNAFVCSTSGAAAHGLKTQRFFSQRFVYDFYTSTRTKPEARYYFDGLWHLLGDRKTIETAPISPFIRNYDGAARPADRKVEVQKAKIAIGGGRSGALWGNRQWPHFQTLASELKDLGAEVYSVGAPGEGIPGCVDLTHMKLRDSIRQMSELDLFVGSDGGAFHIADALLLPTVVIFGPTGLIKNGPMSSNASVIRSDLSCAPCQFRFEFSSCRSPVCMEQIALADVKREILHKLIHGGNASLNSYQDAVRQEIANQSVQVRQPFEAQFIGESFNLYPYFKGSWDTMLSAAMAAKRMGRCKQILQYVASVSQVDDKYRYTRARFAYINRDFEDCISFCLEDENKVARPWVLRNLLLRCCIARHEWKKVADLWDSWADFGGIEDDKRAWVDTAQSAIRALALVERRKDAAELKDRALEMADEVPALTEIAKQMDDTPYRLPSTRGWPHPTPGGGSKVLKIGVVEPWSQLPAALKRYHPNVDVYAFRRNELHGNDAADIGLFIIPFSAEIDPLSPSDFPLGTAQVGEERHEDDSGWLLVAPNRNKDTENHASLDAWFASRLPAETITSPKRIMVIAHHHLEKFNPRGGERSTREILKQVQADEYETIVVVEHKKSRTSGLDETDLARYVLAGHFAFAETLEAAIACWRPDGVVTYGGAGLIAAKVCQQMSVPYTFFPRDWPEVTSLTPFNLLEAAPINNPENLHHSIMNGAFEVITNCKFVGKVLQHLYGASSKNSYVPVQPPSPGFKPKPLHEREEILLINAKKLRGGDYIRYCAIERPDLRFHVVGGDGLPFPPNVRVDEFFDGSDYSEMFQNARAFLFPFENIDTCGTGRVVLEALYCEVPVVSLHRGAMLEILPEKWLVSDTSMEGWLRGLEAVLADNPSPVEMKGYLSNFRLEDQMNVVRNTVEEMSRTRDSKA